jgi:hypothetical protein
LNRWCRFFPTSKLFAKRDNEAFTAPKLYVVTVNRSLGLSDGFAVVSAGEALETDEVAVVADNVGPIICHPRYPQRWIEQIAKAGREQLAIRRRFLSEGRTRAEAEESAMPVLIMWAVPAVIVIGGVGYFLVHAVH